MKIRNSLGHLVDVPKKHEAAIRKHIQSGNHQKVSELVDSFKPKMADGGRTGHNWTVPMYGWGQSGMRVGPYQDGGQTPAGDQQSQPQDQSQGQQQDPQQQQLMQLMQEVEQALQQGASPKEVAKTLAKKGVPRKAAQQIIQQVMSQSAQEGQQQQQPQQGQDQQAPQPQQQAPQGMPQGQTGLRMMATGPGVVPNTDPQLDPQANNPNWAMAQPDLQAPDPGYPNNIQMGPSGANPTSQGAASTTQMTNDTPSPGATGQLKMRTKTPWYTGDFYADRSIYAGNRAQDLNNQYQKDILNTDPKTRLTDQQLNREHQAVQGNQMISGVSAGQSVINGVETGLGIAGKVFSDAQARKEEMEQQFYNNTKNRQMINPDRGNNSTPAFARDGYVIPYGTLPFQMGGAVPTEGSDFQSANPNVMTERGETLTDPNKGPMGPDGRPTGAVVHDTTGDEHSDPSGGNAYKLGPDSVVHSKVLGIRVGDFLAALDGQPHAAYIAGKITEKFPNPDKEVSYAQLAKVFETKKLAEEVEKIAKKAEKIDKEDPGNEGTRISRKTDELNKQTLARQDALKKQQMATNTDITGAQGPIHNVAENLKMQGAYGPKVQKETQDAAQGNPPTAGKGLKMKGKQMLLPTAQYGKRTSYQDLYDNSAAAPNSAEQPYNQPGAQVTGSESYYNTPVPPQVGAESAYGVSQVTPPVNSQIPVMHSNPVVDPSGVTQDASKYSQLPTPYSKNTGLNQFNVGDLYTQYKQRGKVSDDWFNDFTAGVEKGDIIIPSYVGNWNTQGQVKHDDGTYGPVNASDIIAMENHPGMEFMRGIANKYGKAHFDPNDQNMIQDYEKATNDAFEAQGLQPFFTKDNTQPFGSKKFGAWHASVTPLVNQSEGGSGIDPITGKPVDPNDKTMPIFYQNTTSTNAKKGYEESETTKFDPKGGDGRGKSIYREGLNPVNIAGPLASLFMRRDPAPYIEDQGAKNALASNTRQQFYNNQAEKAEIQRAHRAATQYNPQNTPWVTAQSASNAYMANVKSDENAANINAGIQKRYEDRADQLREKAGSNKAVALDQLAKRTADVRWDNTKLTLNAINDIGKAYSENKLENRKSALIQGMFRNAGYDPTSGTYIGNPNASIYAGMPDLETRLRAEGVNDLGIQRILHGEYYTAAGQEKLAKAQEEGREYRGLTSHKNGGKVKRIPERMIKKQKSK